MWLPAVPFHWVVDLTEIFRICVTSEGNVSMASWEAKNPWRQKLEVLFWTKLPFIEKCHFLSFLYKEYISNRWEKRFKITRRDELTVCLRLFLPLLIYSTPTPVIIHFVLISNRRVSILFVADGKLPIFWHGSKKIMIFTPNVRFFGEKLNGWSDKVEIFVTYRSKYLQKKWPK